MIAASAIRDPAYTTAPAHTVTPSPITSGPSSSPLAALDPGRSRGRLPSTTSSSTTAPSPTTTPGCTTLPAPTLAPAPMRAPAWITAPGPSLTPEPSSAPGSTVACAEIPPATARPPPPLGPRLAQRPGRGRGVRRGRGRRVRRGRGRRVRPGRGRGVQRALQALEHPDHPQPALSVGAGLPALAHALDEVLALDPQRLEIGDPGREDVAAAGDVLAVAAGVLVEALVVDRHLALQRHVVEGGHAAGADHGEAPLLVGVKPGQVQVGAQAGGKAQKAEHDVLHPLAHVGGAVGDRLGGLLAGQVQDDGDVVGAQAPERVLVGPQPAQVQAVAVDVVDALAQLAVVGQPLERL